LIAASGTPYLAPGGGRKDAERRAHGFLDKVARSREKWYGRPKKEHLADAVSLAYRAAGLNGQGLEDMRDTGVLEKIRAPWAEAKPRKVSRTARDFWQDVLANPELSSHVIDFVCDGFDLKPRHFWWQALGRRFLPMVPRRMEIFSADGQRRMRSGILSVGKDEQSEYGAALLLLIDAWREVFADPVPRDMDLEGLADRAREARSVVLQTASCIWDMAYGRDRVRDLRRLVESDEPGARDFFERCFWRTKKGPQ
jgi:hypothetical protein